MMSATACLVSAAVSATTSSQAWPPGFIGLTLRCRRKVANKAVREPEASKRLRSAAGGGLTTPTCCAMCSRSEEHTSELQSQSNLVCRLLLEKKKKKTDITLVLTQTPP